MSTAIAIQQSGREHRRSRPSYREPLLACSARARDHAVRHDRHTKEVLLAKIESVSVEESLTARLLGFGRVTIHGTGGTPEVFDRIARPHEFRRQVQIQIETLGSGPGHATGRA